MRLSLMLKWNVNFDCFYDYEKKIHVRRHQLLSMTNHVIIITIVNLGKKRLNYFTYSRNKRKKQYTSWYFEVVDDAIAIVTSKIQWPQHNRCRALFCSRIAQELIVLYQCVIFRSYFEFKWPVSTEPWTLSILMCILLDTCVKLSIHCFFSIALQSIMHTPQHNKLI